MNKEQLARILAAVIFLPAGFGIASCTPCPYTETLETKDLALDEAAACNAAQFVTFGYEGYTISAAECASRCGDSKYNSCSLEYAYIQAYSDANPPNGTGTGGAGGSGGSGGAGGSGGSGGGVTCPMRGATFTCRVVEYLGEYHEGCPIAGRRPSGLVDMPMNTRDIGKYFASSAYFEAASVAAFHQLREELSRLGAPTDLLEDLHHAALEEVRHAAQMTSLAMQYGATVDAIVIHPGHERSVLEIALENASEGLVNETFAAAVALFQAEHAQDPEVRQTMTQIANEECGHAVLALRIAAFLDGHLDDAQRTLVETRKRNAIDTLDRLLKEPSAEVRVLAGVPSSAEAKIMVHRLRRGLWMLCNEDHVEERCQPLGTRVSEATAS